MAVSVAKVLAEYLAMLLFVFICAGSATGVAGVAGSAWVHQVSMTFGFCIFVLAVAFGRWGVQINCAVTFGLAIAKMMGIQGADLEIPQAGANLVGQLLGSISGAALLALVKGPDSDKTGTLGVNMLAADIGYGEAFVGEVIGTFLLMFVVMQVITEPLAPLAPSSPQPLAPLAIGMAVYLAHSFLIPVDGCSINPTRSFGPAVVASIRLSGDNDTLIEQFWEDHWVFWLGPLVGSALAVAVHKAMAKVDESGKAVG